MTGRNIYDAKFLEESKNTSTDEVDDIISKIYSSKTTLSRGEYLKCVLIEAKKFRVKGMLNYFYDILFEIDSMNLHDIEMEDIYSLKNTIGTMLFYQSSYDLALKYYMEGLDYIGINDSLQRGSIYNNLGEVYREIKEYDHALLYYSWAKELFQEEGLEFHYSVVGLNMALVLIKEKNYEGAGEYVQNSIDVLNKDKYQVNYGDALSIKGRVYFKMGKIVEAKNIYEKAYGILKESGNSYYLLKHFINMGELFIFQGDMKKGLDHYLNGLGIAKMLRNNRLASVLEERISMSYESMDNYQEALKHYKEFDKYKSLYLEQNLKTRINGLNIEYEKNHSNIHFESHEMENQLLKQKSLELKSMNVSLINEIAIRERSHVKLKATNERLMKISMLDELTQIPNRRYFIDSMVGIKRDSHVENIGIVMVDIDHFKRFNDFYGHGDGDQALVEVAMVLSKIAEKFEGFVVRHGGEEFVLVFTNINRKYMAKILKGVKFGITDLKIPHVKGLPNGILTVSQGAVIINNRYMDIENMLEMADEALYMAKGKGRNTYVIYK